MCGRDSEWTCRIYEGLAGVAHARFGDSDTVLVSVEFQQLGAEVRDWRCGTVTVLRCLEPKAFIRGGHQRS